MADFMENEAVESDSDGSEDLARKKRPVGSLFVFGCFINLENQYLSECTTAGIYKGEKSGNLNSYARWAVLMRKRRRRMRRHTRSRCRVSSMTTMNSPGQMTREVEKGKRRKGGGGDQGLQVQGPVQDLQSRDLGLDQVPAVGGGGPTTKTLTRMTWTSSKRIWG